MARMHSRKKGKSGSKKPVKLVKPSWSRYSESEIETLVLKIAKSAKSPSQIGMILRDSYGVPDVKLITKKTISKILEENKLLPKLPEDIVALIKKQIKLKKHLGNNKHDFTAKRGIQLTESKINRLAKYYKSTKKLPSNWKFDREQTELLIN